MGDTGLSDKYQAEKNKLYHKSVEKPVETYTVKYKKYKKILNVALKAAEEN